MVNDFLKKLTRTDDQELFNFGGAWIKSVIIRGTAYELIRGNNPKHYPKSYWSVCFTTIDMDTLQPNEVIQFTFRPTKNAIEFVTIATKNRKSAKGLNSHSTNVLRFICDLADETQVQLFGAVEPLEEDGLSEEKLYRWYKLFNFFKNGLSEKTKHSVARLPE
tara:strand:+ start:67 stop:555 length:489 start_codon:yes stop_codon:yes gene_type:complete